MEESMIEKRSDEARDASYWLTEAPVMKAIVHMAVPMILGMVAMAVYNFTDTLFVGMLADTAALAALPLSMPVMSLFLAVSMFFEVGAGTFIARAIGAGDRGASQAASSFALIGAFGTGTILAAAFTAGMDPLLGVLGASGDTFIAAKRYLTIFCIGAPFVILNMVGGQLVRAVAKSKQASLGVVASAAINIVLDPVLIFACGLGLEGAALATVASNIAAAVYYLVIIAKSDALAIALPATRLDCSQMFEVAKVGMSALLMGLLMGSGSLVFNNIAMRCGAEVVAAFGIAQSVVQLLEVVTMGLYEGVVPLIGGAWGAGDGKRLRAVVKKTALCLAVFCAAACAAVLAFAQPLVGLFSGDAAVMEAGVMILAAQVLAVPLAAGSGLVMGVLQACGKGLFANALSVAKGCACIPCFCLGGLLFGVAGVAWSLAAAEALGFLAALLLQALAFAKKPRPDAPMALAAECD